MYIQYQKSKKINMAENRKLNGRTQNQNLSTEAQVTTKPKQNNLAKSD